MQLVSKGTFQTHRSKYNNAVVPKMEDKHKQTKNTGHSI